jgi:predicted CopG family antitoxin
MDSMRSMRPTTISIEPEVKEALKAHCAGGSYSDAIRRLIHRVEADGFSAASRHAMEDPEYPWIDEKDFEWD